MIEVIVNRPGFEYDIHSLVKAFFPREDVSVRMQEEFREDTRLCMAVEFTDSLVQAEFFEEKESKGKRLKRLRRGEGPMRLTMRIGRRQRIT